MVLSEEYQRYVGGKYQTEYDYLQGTIHDLDLTPASPALIIAWETGNICAYRVEELESNSISPILPLQRIGSSVAYEVSKDEKYYKVFVALAPKGLPKAGGESSKRNWVMSATQLKHRKNGSRLGGNGSITARLVNPSKRG